MCLKMFEGISLVSLTPPALLGLAILMILTGRLWTNSAYQQKAEEAEKWREAYEKEREARAMADAQTNELLDTAKTSQAFIRAVFQNSERVRQRGGSDVSEPVLEE